MGQRTCDIGHATVGRRRLFVASLVLTGAAVPAHAKPLKVPADHPAVVMDVPDDWSVETSATGIELRSPQKNSIVVVKVIDQKKANADAFANESALALKAFGVTFPSDAKAPPKRAAASNGLSQFGQKPENFTFSGSPSLALPGTAQSNDPQAPAENSVESLTGFGATVTGGEQKLPMKVAQYFGTTLNGQPVDVQFVLYRLPDKHYFAMMQESGAEDTRTVTMAQSIKPVK